MRNITFVGEGQALEEGIVMAPQHCGFYSQDQLDAGVNYGMATLCNVDYVFEDVDFTSVGGTGKWVSFLDIPEGNPTGPVYTSQDDSLNEQVFLISSLYNGFEKINGCHKSDNYRFKEAIACNNSQIENGRLVIWTSSS